MAVVKKEQRKLQEENLEKHLKKQKEAATKKSMEELKDKQKEILESKSLNIRTYLLENLVPILTEGLLDICKNQPEDPVDNLAGVSMIKDPSVTEVVGTPVGDCAGGIEDVDPRFARTFDSIRTAT